MARAAAQLLLDQGASVDAQDKIRKTPLDHAVAGDHSDVAELLRRRGANQ